VIWRLRIAACVLTFGLAAIVSGNTQDYTQWRGSSGDGAASAFTPPATWPVTLKRKWLVNVGEGYSTPLLTGNVVYCFSRRDGNERLTALDADTGKERWHSEYPAPYTPGQPASAHGAGPKATPVLNAGHLFTLGISGIVTAFDAAKGRILWRTPAPAEAPFFGAAASPLAENGLVFAHPGNYGPLTAFEAISGTVKWKAGDGGFFASPLVANLSGVRQLVAVTQSSVIGVSSADGALLWKYAWPGGEGGTMPVLHGETVIVGGLNAGVAAFTPRLRDGKWTVEPKWTTNAATMYVSNPVVIGDTLYGFSRRASGQFFALDAATGRTLWLGRPREATNAAIVKAGDFLFLLKDDAEMIVAKANRARLQVIRRYQVADAATWAQPVISGKRILIRDTSSLAMWTVE
jgi:outer membrane protein assembly factor BamB